MSDYNKLLWAMFIIAISGLLSLLIKNTKSKIALTVLTVIFVLMLLSVSVSWVFFDFWI